MFFQADGLMSLTFPMVTYLKTKKFLLLSHFSSNYDANTFNTVIFKAFYRVGSDDLA